jgi:hypothetical protein
MAVTSLKGTGVKNDGGTIFGAGTSATGRFNNLSQAESASASSNLSYTGVSPHFDNGVQSLLKSTNVSITAITQYLTSGFVNIQKSTHGLSVGDFIEVNGTDVPEYNTVHRVTFIVNANNFVTNVPYTANTSTHGSYKTFTGLFNRMTLGKYIATIIGDTVAGQASDVLVSPSSEFRGVPYAPARGNHRYDVVTYDYLTHKPIKGPNAGDAFAYTKLSDGTSLAKESFPTKAVPGRFVYYVGQPDGAVTETYNPAT